MNASAYPKKSSSGQLSPRNAVIYTRVSNDQQSGRSPEEQEADCRKECSRNGWPIRKIITDNDKSASRYRTTERPGYIELQQILRPGDVLVTWESSRGYRDLEDYIIIRNLCATKDVLLSYNGRTYDLTEGEDRFTTGLDALIAERYAEETRKRILRAHRANMEAGKPHGRIPYGYKAIRDPENGKIIQRVPDPVEAPIIREIAHRIIAGESLSSICRDLNARGLSTRGREWNLDAVKKFMRRPSNAGLRSHNGKVVTEGTWEPLISVEEWRKVLAILDDPARTAGRWRGVEPKYLLSNIAVCGVCGEPVWQAPVNQPKRKDGTRKRYYVYRCFNGGHVSRNVARTDEVIERAMILLLEDPRVIARLEKTDDSAAIEAMEHAQHLRDYLDEQIEAIMDEDLPPAMTAKALRRLNDRLMPEIEAAEARSIQSATNPLLHKLSGPNAGMRWAAMTVAEKRDAIRSAFRITLLRTGNPGGFDPKSVKVEWRV